jgi:hypothetical protein
VFTEADLDDDAGEQLGADLGEEMPEEPQADDVSDDTLDAAAMATLKMDDDAIDADDEAPRW